jgi:sortase A
MWKFSQSISRGHRLAESRDPRQSRRRMVLVWIERLLLLSGMAFLVFYGAARAESWIAARAALKRFNENESHPNSNVEPPVSHDHRSATEGLDSRGQFDPPDVDFSLWDPRRIKAHGRGVEKQSGIPLAVLRIPKIRLEAPLFDGTDDVTLNHAVGRIAGTARPDEPGNIGIAGHRDGFFRGLKDVSVGDAIELKTPTRTATYLVDRIQIVAPRQIEVLRPTAVPSLTLVTCYPFYFAGRAPQRYVVTASLLEKDVPQKIGEATAGAPATASNSIRRKQMNLLKKATFFSKGAGAIVLALVAFGTAAAQDTTVTTITQGQSSFDTQVKNAEIVYVEGNDLVLKLENGRVEHLVVPDTDKFTIDGKEVSVSELVPGTKLTQTITTTTTPRYVNSVRTMEGKVWHVNAPQSVILAFPDNTHQVFNVPSHAKFMIDGKEKTVFDLRKGMKIKATVVTDEEHTVMEQTKFAYGQAPKIVTPSEVGVLLFFPVQHPQATLASAEAPAEMLPETGSALPLIGLVGTLALAMSAGLFVTRRRYLL